jgi:hypothetical protein
MKVYTAHRPPDTSPDKTLFIKEGFSWPGFLFPVIWLPIKRLWLALALYVLAVAVLSTVASVADLSSGSLIALGLALHFFFGFEANSLYRRALMRRGFTEEGPFLGEDVEEAELRYFQSQAFRQSSAPHAPAVASALEAVPRPGP